jgi:hypothetical protein
MKSRSQLLLISLLACGAAIAGCSAEDPTQPINHNPVIHSVTLFPQSIGPGDSAIVVCEASDRDGQTLVFDWQTDAALRIKGAHNGVYLYDSRDKSQIFYYGTPTTPTDTAWIACSVRDDIGGMDTVILQLRLHP